MQLLKLSLTVLNIDVIVHYPNLHLYNSWTNTFCNMILMYHIHGNAMSDLKWLSKDEFWDFKFSDDIIFLKRDIKKGN